MKYAFTFAAIGILAVTLSGCRQQDIRTAEVKVPTVVNSACENRVKDALRPLKGIDMNSIAFADRTVTVRYDSMMLGLKNIEHAIKDAGFDANEFPADPTAKAALPRECLTPTAQ